MVPGLIWSGGGALSAAGTDLGPSGLEVGGGGVYASGTSPGESRRTRALRLWGWERGPALLGTLPPTLRLGPHSPLSVAATACTWWSLCQCPATTWRPTACCAQCKYEERSTTTIKVPAPPPRRPCPYTTVAPAHPCCPAPAQPPPLTPSFSLPSEPSPVSREPLLPSDTTAVAGDPGRGAEIPPSNFPFPPSLLPFAQRDSFRVPACAPGTMSGTEGS